MVEARNDPDGTLARLDDIEARLARLEHRGAAVGHRSLEASLASLGRAIEREAHKKPG